jgi:hypothetical protein
MDDQKSHPDSKARWALIVWGVFILLNIFLNGTIPFLMGRDLHAWTASPTKDALFGLIQYGVMFLVVPLILAKGWDAVLQPAFLLPLALAVLAFTLRPYLWPVSVIAVPFLLWLHLRYGLTDLGFRSRGWKGDVLVALLVGFLYASPLITTASSPSFDFGGAIAAWVDRSFANPASTVENLFYFGFLTERLSSKTGRWFTPFLIGAMYAAHEMTNPEYWYEGVNFVLIFIGVTLSALLRRSVIVIWLGDGLGRFLSSLF